MMISSFLTKTLSSKSASLSNSIKMAFSTPVNKFNLFEKIIKREIPSTIVYEDDKCLAFKDVTPAAPVHLLLIPKVVDGLTQLQNAEDRHKEVLGHMMVKVGEIAKQHNLQEGYRVVINDGSLGCQSVYHLHLHIIGGTQMGWPPGVLGKAETIKPGSQ